MLPYDRTPEGPWLRTWLLAVVLMAGILGGLEQFWRGRDHRPTIVDNEGLWSYQRRRASGSNTVALVGASRMLLDVDTRELDRLLPRAKVVQLAIIGKAPMATLRDLAHDESFSGTVLCAALPPAFERARREEQQSYVRYARERATLNETWDRYLGALVHERLVVTNWNLNLLQVALDRFEDEPWPQPLHVVTHADRSRSADYTLPDVAFHRSRRTARRLDAYRKHPAPDPRSWFAEASEVAPWVDRILARGGRVIFIRLPTSGEHWKLDQLQYPRKLYWDRLAIATGALTLHFRDDKRLAKFECPDTSHLGANDKLAFTRALVDALRRRGMLTGPNRPDRSSATPR